MRDQYHKLLKKCYIDRQSWDITDNPSQLYIANNGLYDMHRDYEQVHTFELNGRVVYGFRIIPKCADLRLHHHDVPAKYLDNAAELNRLVTDPDYAHLGLFIFVGKLFYDYCRQNKLRYGLSVTSEQRIIDKFKRIPGLTVLKNSCHYPDSTLHCFIFDTWNPLLRLYYSDLGFKIIAGTMLVRRLLKNWKY